MRGRRLATSAELIVEAADDGFRPPARVGCSSFDQDRFGDRAKAAAPMEPCGELAGDRLDVREAGGARRLNRLLVQTFGIENAFLQTGQFGRRERGTACKRLSTSFGPARELSLMLRDRFAVPGSIFLPRRVVSLRVGQGAV